MGSAYQSAKNSKSVEVRYLSPGMILAWTGAEVITSPTAGISTSRGKMDLIVKTKKGDMVQKSWNRHTLISIIN